MTATKEDWSVELERFERREIELAPGLTDEEFRRAEEVHGFRFPPDLRSFLSCALPVGPEFPDWRNPDSPGLRGRFEWPIKGIVGDVKRKSFWFDEWGPRPSSLSKAREIAKAGVEAAPRLIPVYSHRYMPEEPRTSGNPVLSVYMTDVIPYGADLRDYFRKEFGERAERDEPVGDTLRPIRFWDAVMEFNNTPRYDGTPRWEE